MYRIRLKSHGLMDYVERTLAKSATARASVVLLFGSMLGHVGNYLFYVVSARAVGPAQFAEVSALAGGVAMIVFMPLVGVQAAVAREIARLRALGQREPIAALVRRLVLLVAVVGTSVMGLLVLATPLAVAWLHLSTSSIWLVTVVYIALGVALVSLLGVAQGLSRFRTVGVMLGGPLGTLRPLLVLPFVAVVGSTGPMWALLVATIVGLVVLGWIVAPYLRQARARSSRAVRLPRLWTTLVALIAFASLISSDAVVAKIALPDESAGLYNTGALLGKIAFYGPSALAMLLLPLVTARLERGQDIRRLLSLTLLITVGMGLVVSAVLFVAPRGLVTAVFGARYADAFPLAAPYALVMTLYAALYVHLMVAVAAARTAFTRILAGAAVLQLALFVVLHSSWWQLLAATAVAAVAGFVLHEATSSFGLIGLWRHKVRTRRAAAVSEPVS